MFHDRTNAKPHWFFKVTLAALAGIAGASALVSTAFAANDPWAAKPYMGWSSWSALRGGANDAIVRAEADAMAAHLHAFGYTYLNIDAGWQSGYDGNGRPVASSSKYPTGITGLANYVHAKGLKLGIYFNPGMEKSVYTAAYPIIGTTCTTHDIGVPSQNGNTAGTSAIGLDFTNPCSDAYLLSIAKQVASWGVDFIKMDFVGPGGGRTSADDRDYMIHYKQALEKSGREIWLELSNSLSIANIAIWQESSNGWRIGGDVECYSACNNTTLTNWAKASNRFPAVPQWAQYAGPGGWNDLDSLELGNGTKDGLTVTERQTIMTLWAISAAPLSLGSDLRTLDAGDLVMMTNAEVIAVDQAGLPETPFSQASSQQVWCVKPTTATPHCTANPDGTYTVALFNLGSASATVSVNWSDVGFAGSAAVRDLWAHTNLGTMATGISQILPSHGSMLVTVTPGGSGDFTLTPSPSSQTVVAGNAAGYSATIAALNGFTGDVSLSLTGLPAGATATFSPATLNGGSGTSALNVMTSASTPAGNYTLTIHATSGALTHTATVGLTVTALPDFTLTPCSSITVVAGSSATCTIAVGALNGFTGSVSLSIGSGLPAGASASFNPVSVTVPGSSVLTISTTAATVVGNYSFTISGVQGSVNHVATLSLSVTSAKPVCTTDAAGSGWHSAPFTAQTGTFTASWDASVPVAPTNDIMGLSNGAQTANTGYAVIVSFSNTGNIVAINGGTYTATTLIAYKVGVSYHFRVVVNVPAHTYSVYVTPAGGTETAIATNFAFRTEQNKVTVLNSVGSNADATGSFTYCSFTVQ